MDLVPNKPEYWQNKAEEAWSIATEISDAHCKAVMVRIAQGYEKMVAWAEEDTYCERGNSVDCREMLLCSTVKGFAFCQSLCIDLFITENGSAASVAETKCSRLYCSGVQAMLNNLSEQVRQCHMHAEHCAQQASVQTDPKLKDDFLEMERRWLTLARSYEFTERLADFSDETKRRVDKLPKNAGATVPATLIEGGQRRVDRYVVLRHLAQARQHQHIGERHLARQHEIIVELERDGHDTTEAKKLFAQFLVMQAMHIEHRTQLERELEETESSPTPNSLRILPVK